ncbi:MAG: O-antigen ligase family protein [Bacilli bacterium]
MLKGFTSFQNKVRSLLNNKYIEEIYVILVLLISFLGWNYNSIVGISILVFVATLAIITTNDLKYIIPIVIFLPFSIGFSFSATEVPIPLIVIVGIFVVVLTLFTIFNGIHLSKMKSSIPLLGIGITTLIPILWFTPKDESQVMFYFVYFGNLLFFVLYFLLSNGIREDGKIIISKSFAYLIVLFTLQLIIRIIQINGKFVIMEDIFYCGWGLCNEVGIMLCFSLPFAFYLINKSNSTLLFLYRLIFIIVGGIGIFFSYSRASYIFGGLIIILSFITSSIINKNKKSMIIMGILLIIVLVVAVVFNELLIRIISKVFEDGLESNGRIKLYNTAWNIITSSLRNIIFGAGSCTYIGKLFTAGGIQEGQVVFHSTFFQTMIVGGIFCLAFLLIHLVQKYKMLFSLEKKLAIPLFISFILVDAYGMMDNTYHMFYYMIPLVTIMACFDSQNKGKIKTNINSEEINISLKEENEGIKIEEQI